MCLINKLLYLCNSRYTINQNQINMGYNIKIQRVERKTTKSFYVNFPAAVAEAANIKKGEEMEWVIEDKNTFVLRRVKPLVVKRIKK